MDTYQDILSAVLSSVHGKTGADFENSLLDTLRTMGLTEDTISKVQDSFMLLDRTSETVMRMSKARADGISRPSYIAKEMDAITDGLTVEEKEAILATIVSSDSVNEEYRV